MFCGRGVGNFKEIGLNVGEKKEEFKKISINFMPFLVNSWISLLERI